MLVDLNGQVLLDKRVVLGSEGGEVGAILLLFGLGHSDGLLDALDGGLELLVFKWRESRVIASECCQEEDYVAANLELSENRVLGSNRCRTDNSDSSSRGSSTHGKSASSRCGGLSRGSYKGAQMLS